MRGYAKKQKRLQTKTHLFINQNIVHMYTIHHMLQFNEKWALLIIHHFPIWSYSSNSVDQYASSNTLNKVPIKTCFYGVAMEQQQTKCCQMTHQIKA